jgi:GrpB-like predicted nucleotidyltransferase (UPF0157 family)
MAQYDPAWLAAFDSERDRVAAVLEPWLAAPVEHSGNRNAYTNAKAGFVARVVSAAGIELPARDRLPE